MEEGGREARSSTKTDASFTKGGRGILRWQGRWPRGLVLRLASLLVEVPSMLHVGQHAEGRGQRFAASISLDASKESSPLMCGDSMCVAVSCSVDVTHLTVCTFQGGAVGRLSQEMHQSLKQSMRQWVHLRVQRLYQQQRSSLCRKVQSFPDEPEVQMARWSGRSTLQLHI